MKIDKECMLEMAELISKAVVTALKETAVGNDTPGVKKATKTEKNAYQKTEQLLYNYNNFKRVVADRRQEIEELRVHGVPKRGGAVVQYGSGSNVPKGLVLKEESVEIAVHNIECAIQGTVQAIALIDKCMAALKNDPYYKILEMRYFEGRTLEHIGAYFNCDHSTISRNKSRLVKELSMQLFPDEVISEYMR